MTETVLCPFNVTSEFPLDILIMILKWGLSQMVSVVHSKNRHQQPTLLITKYSCSGWTHYSWFVHDLRGKNEPLVGWGHVLKFSFQKRERFVWDTDEHTHTHMPQLIFTDDHMATSILRQCGCNFKDEPKKKTTLVLLQQSPILSSTMSGVFLSPANNSSSTAH